MAASKEKAKEILRHGEVRGEPLTPKQKGLFGLIAGGKKPTRIGKKKRPGLKLRRALQGE